MELRPHKVTFTTSTKNANYTSGTLVMKGIDSDGSTVLWTETVGNIDSTTFSTVGNTQEFILPEGDRAYYLQFELTGTTTVTKQTVAGTITVDYFYELKTINPLGKYHTAGLPNIVGILDVRGAEISGTIAKGAFSAKSGSAGYGKGHEGGANGAFTFDASRVSSIYGNSATVTPESLATAFFIRY